MNRFTHPKYNANWPENFHKNEKQLFINFFDWWWNWILLQVQFYPPPLFLYSHHTPNIITCTFFFSALVTNSFRDLDYRTHSSRYKKRIKINSIRLSSFQWRSEKCQETVRSTYSSNLGFTDDKKRKNIKIQFTRFWLDDKFHFFFSPIFRAQNQKIFFIC